MFLFQTFKPVAERKKDDAAEVTKIVTSTNQAILNDKDVGPKALELAKNYTGNKNFKPADMKNLSEANQHDLGIIYATNAQTGARYKELFLQNAGEFGEKLWENFIRMAQFEKENLKEIHDNLSSNPVTESTKKKIQKESAEQDNEVAKERKKFFDERFRTG